MSNAKLPFTSISTGAAPNNFASSSNHCNFLVGRYNLWSNQINNVGPLQTNQLHAKLRILHRAYDGSGCS